MTIDNAINILSEKLNLRPFQLEISLRHKRTDSEKAECLQMISYVNNLIESFDPKRSLNEWIKEAVEA